jgi:hypothetical protein
VPRRGRAIIVGRATRGRVGTLLHCAGLSLLAWLILLACEGTSESTQPAEHQGEQGVAVAQPQVELADTAENALIGEVRVLPPVSANSKSSESESNADSELRAALSWAMMEYRSAFVGRDLAKLESIWSMGAVERLLIKNAWSSCDRIDLSIETLEMRVAGRNAVVDFDQELAFQCPSEARTRHSKLSASLELKDAGEWTISRIGDRAAIPIQIATAGPARMAPRQRSLDVDAAMHRALETLSDYESAMQRCDLKGLSRVWIMTDLERQILQGLCFRSGRLEVSVSEPQVSTNNGKVSIDFIHDLTSQRRGNRTHTRSKLTALLIERDDGNLTIWKVRATE